MKQHSVRLAAVLLAGVLSFSLCVLTSCKGKESSNVEVYTPYVPENKIDENAPGEELDTRIGETINYQDKVSVTLNQVIEFDSGNNGSNRFFVAELSITNNSSGSIDCSSLTHFSSRINDDDDTSPVRNVNAAIFARKYYTKIGSDMMLLNQAIDPGQTVDGYIYFASPEEWEKLQIIYIPYKYYSNDKVLFEITEEKITHYTEEL